MKLLCLLLLSMSLWSADLDLYVYEVNTYRVIDGDSIAVVVHLGFDIHKKTVVRVIGINTPEVRGDEKPAGVLVKDYVTDFLDGKTLYLQWIKDDKFGGRCNGIIYADGIDLGKHLLSVQLAKPYTGTGPKLSHNYDEIVDRIAVLTTVPQVLLPAE